MSRPFTISTAPVSDDLVVPEGGLLPRIPESEDVLLSDAQKTMEAVLAMNKTAKDPLTGANVKTYKITLTRIKVACLMVFARHALKSGNLFGAFHFGQVIQSYPWKSADARSAATYGGGPATHLMWWGLIEPLPPDVDADKPHDGMYRMTCKGWDYFNKTIAVPLFVRTLMGEIVNVSETTIDRDTALGDFDFHDLMEG